ncbi:hypothetical protein CHCC20335_3658 [Bacillus paralicheniformis]|nr:hypothetical protein CHCC20335_3658 [Bacillus paralicheniformis]
MWKDRKNTDIKEFFRSKKLEPFDLPMANHHSEGAAIPGKLHAEIVISL